MAAIDTVYNYYLSTYSSRSVSRYDTHRRNELRDIYISIRNINKETPLYKIKNASEAQKYAIDMKEAAGRIMHVISSLNNSGKALDQIFKKKVAISSNENIVSARYIGSNLDTANDFGFTIDVKHLAQPQINVGNFLDREGASLEPGEYAFDLSTNSSSYEFQFNVHEGDSNLSIQKRLARLINNANIGLTADVIEDRTNLSALRIQSVQTGLTEKETCLFEIRGENNYNSAIAMKVLGIGNITQPASNSSFLLDGKEFSSYSNKFVINQMFELNLNNVSEDGNATRVGFKADVDAISDNISDLADAYNNMVTVSLNHLDSNGTGSKLYHSVAGIAHYYKNDLEAIGLLVDDSGMISIDKDLLAEATTKEDYLSAFHVLNSFKDSISTMASRTSLNPMDYVNKIIVSYKNPGHNFPSAYASSTYAGMIFDFSC
jgi:flagellar hook-associated protein 2